MPERRSQHIVPSKDGWTVRGAGIRHRAKLLEEWDRSQADE